jgi:phage terminase small subunit
MSTKKPVKPVKKAPAKTKATATPKRTYKPRKPQLQVSNRKSKVLKPGSEPKPISMHPGLTPKQSAFVNAYLKCGNATQAAIAAGYSQKTAGSIGAENLKKPEIQAHLKPATIEIVARHVELIEELVLNEARIIRECARLAFFDARKLFNDDGSPKGILELDDDTAAAVAGLEVLEQYEGAGDSRRYIGDLKKYKIADKNSSLERAAKILGMFKKHQEQPMAPLKDAMTELLERMGPSALGVVKSPPKDDS